MVKNYSEFIVTLFGEITWDTREIAKFYFLKILIRFKHTNSISKVLEIFAI